MHIFRCCNEKGGISTAVQQERISNQLSQIEWLFFEATRLNPEPPTWVLVTGHYPIYSGGEHGDSSELIEHLNPLLEKYNVDGYFSGHDHLAQHLQINQINYFISGGGALTSTSKTNVSFLKFNL